MKALSAIAVPWIKACGDTHKKCRQLKDTPLPSRVLDVGRDGDRIALKDSEGLRGAYTILSHCWGKKPTITTTPLNVTSRRSGIQYDELPLTFQHAVTVTRVLGIKYLWIDSLCIIQDPLFPRDWQKESQNMLQYYKNSYVTIGALEASDSFAGFLPCRNTNSIAISVEHNVYARPLRQQWSDIYGSSVLESRAWCLQERLLSTRIIQFTNAELLWECETMCQRESDSLVEDGPLSVIWFSGPRNRHLIKWVLAQFENGAYLQQEALSLWYQVVELYSTRRLTVATDKLPAISGVAAGLQSLTGFTYLHGLWKEELGKGLLWEPALYQEVSDSGELTGAPSWSWAASTQRISYTWPSRGEFKIQVQGTSSNGNELSLRGRCRQVALSDILQTRSDMLPSRVGAWKVRIVDEKTKKEINLAQVDRIQQASLPGVYKIVEVVERSEPQYFKGASIEYDWHIFFLVLAPHKNLDGKWERIGFGVSQKLHDQHAGRERPRLLFDNCKYEDICLV